MPVPHRLAFVFAPLSEQRFDFGVLGTVGGFGLLLVAGA